MPAACADRIPLCESSIAAHVVGSTPIRRAASRKTSGAGLPAPTSSEETQVLKSFAKPPASITTSITSRFDDDACPSGQRAASRSTASTAPGSSGNRPGRPRAAA